MQISEGEKVVVLRGRGSLTIYKSQGFTYNFCVYADFREKKRSGFKREVVLGQAFTHI